MQVSIAEFNKVINGGADAAVKAALGRLLDRVKGKEGSRLNFEIELTATEIERDFERLMVNEFRAESK